MHLEDDLHKMNYRVVRISAGIHPHFTYSLPDHAWILGNVTVVIRRILIAEIPVVVVEAPFASGGGRHDGGIVGCLGLHLPVASLLLPLEVRTRCVVDERELQQRPEHEGETHARPHVNGLGGRGDER